MHRFINISEQSPAQPTLLLLQKQQSCMNSVKELYVPRHIPRHVLTLKHTVYVLYCSLGMRLSMWRGIWEWGYLFQLNLHVVWPIKPRKEKLVEQSQTGQWEGLGTKFKKNNCLWPSCPHSKTTRQPRNPLSFSLAMRCFHCSTTYLAFNCFHHPWLKKATHKRKLFMGSVLVEGYTTVFCLHLLNVLKFPLIYPLASYLCVCCGTCMRACVCACVCLCVSVSV